jgi:uncharacterized membrane protein YfcA
VARADRPSRYTAGVTFLLVAAAAAALAGAVAAIAGFGIGSLLTPLVAWRTGTSAAIAIVSIPHAVASAIRLFAMRQHVDREVFFRFGLASAAGGLAGAALHAAIRGAATSYALGVVLVVAGLLGASGLGEKIHLGRTGAWIAGVASGLFGGLVGNQGGIRSAALLGLDVERDAFVATATASALVVDLARVPVYAASRGEDIAREVWLVVAMSAGAAIGTFLGRALLGRVPERAFKRVVSGLVVALGALVITGAALGWPGFA